MSPWWLLPAGASVIAVIVLSIMVAVVAAEAVRLQLSMRRLQRLAVAADELSREAAHARRSVSAVTERTHSR